MKKIALSAILAATAQFANAQAGSWYAGGNVGFSSTTRHTDNNGTEVKGLKETSWTFAPEVGTFLTNHVQLGVGVTLAGSKTEPAVSSQFSSTSVSYGATLYSRYFFGKGTFRPFLGINAFVLPGQVSNDNNVLSATARTMTTGANLNAGFGYGLNERFTVVGSFGTLGYRHTVREVNNSGVKEHTSNFGLDAGTLGQRFTVGVYYTFLK